MKLDFSDRMSEMNGTATREILKLLSRPEIISFAGGLPATEALPTAEIKAICDDILSRPDSYKLLQYGTTEGLPELMDEIVKLAADFGVAGADRSNTLVISGGQQGIDLVCKSLINKGDVILVENPTYLAALQIFNSYEAKTVGVDVTDEGLDTEDLERKIAKFRPKFVYLVPTFSNPTGKTYTQANRREIARISAKYGVWVLEDDPYARLRFEGEKVDSLYSYAQDDNILYMASFSKIMSPGLRVGGIIGNPAIVRKMAIGKQGTDLHTGALSQAVALEYCKRGLLRPAVERSLPLYRTRKDAMIRCIDKYMPEEFVHTYPNGGLFVWGEFKGCDIDTGALLNEAVKNNVAYIQGSVFYADGSGKNTVRLNYSNASPERIEEGMKNLGAFFKQVIAKA